GTCHRTFRGLADPRHAVNPGFDQVFGTPDDVIGSYGVVRMDQDGQPVVDPLFGAGRQVTGRAAPMVLSVLWAPRVFWDGRAGPSFTDPQTGAVVIPQGGALEQQSVGPIVQSAEMAHDGRTWDEVAAKLASVIPMALATHLPPDMADAIAGQPSYSSLF